MGKELRRRIHIIPHYLAFGGNGWSERVSIDLESKAEAEELVAPPPLIGGERSWVLPLSFRSISELNFLEKQPGLVPTLLPPGLRAEVPLRIPRSSKSLASLLDDSRTSCG